MFSKLPEFELKQQTGLQFEWEEVKRTAIQIIFHSIFTLNDKL